MPLKVYYVDDEPSLLELFTELFATRDVEIKTFADPMQAVAAIRADPPDLVFLDYRLPKTSGPALAAQIDAKIPKALITGDLLPKPDANFVAVFEKPFREDAIEAFIRSYLKPAAAA